MKTQLLCTFTNQKNLEQITHDITKNFDIVFNKIYVLQNEDNTKELSGGNDVKRAMIQAGGANYLDLTPFDYDLERDRRQLHMEKLES